MVEQFAPNVPEAQKSFCTHPMVLLGDKAQVEACFGLFGDSVTSSQDMCTVCAERTIGLENHFGHTQWNS
jgi:hypothetical protein